MTPSHLLTFVTEATTLLSHAEGALRGMERGGDIIEAGSIQECFKYVHSVCGFAQFLKLQRIYRLAHTTELLLEDLRTQPGHRGTAICIHTLLRAVQRLNELVRGVLLGIKAPGNEDSLIGELESLICEQYKNIGYIFIRQACASTAHYTDHRLHAPTGPPGMSHITRN